MRNQVIATAHGSLEAAAQVFSKKGIQPVILGDTITGRIELTSVREDKPICTMAVSVRNQKGEDVARRGVERRPLSASAVRDGEQVRDDRIIL